MKSIVIVGAGYGGLRAALDLNRGLRSHGLGGAYEIVLIDRTANHLFTPLLYKLAADPVFPESALSYPFAEFAGGSIRFMEDEVREMDLMNGDVHLTRGEELKSDYLVLAPGSETNYFNIPGLPENSLPLKTLADARAIRNRLAALPVSAHVVVGGGGPNGIELASEIRRVRALSVSLVEAMPTLLTGFQPHLAVLAEKRLKKLGVEVLTAAAIGEAKTDRLVTKDDKEIPFDLFIWTGGVKVPAWVSGLPLKIEARGRIEAAAGMECLPRSEDLRFAPMVYALGDAVCVYDASGKPMPGVARAAIEQGKIVAANILEDILAAEGRSAGASHRTYRPVHYPYVLPMGGNYALGAIGPFILRGLSPFAFEQIIRLDYLLSIMPLGAAIRTWAKGLT